MKIVKTQGKLQLKSKTENTRTIAINRRSTVAVIVVFALLIGLIGRLAYLQLVSYEQYRIAAYANYTGEYKLAAKRGVIYDRNMNVLAKSVSVETVFISPFHIENNQQAAIIANGLSEILDVDRGEIFEKTTRSQSKYQIIKKDVDLNTGEKVREFVKENKLQNIVHLEESSKRNYIYGSLASHTIGYINEENQGVYGLEAYYDEILRGVDGRVIRGKDGRGNYLPIKYENNVEPVNGSNLVLTIDWTIQGILEKHLKDVYEYTNPRNRAMGIIMDVNNGEILAMSVMPSYDLNSPQTLDARSQAILDSFVGTTEEKNKLQTELLYKMWTNKLVSEPFETGSTFKVITAAMAYEENENILSSVFTCKYGGIEVGGLMIPCHLKQGHGTQTFVQALQNSCNPSFVQIAQQLGKGTFYKYVDQFGYFESSGIDTIGEAAAIWHKNFNEVELAVSSFGQTFKVTAMAHVRALAAVANGGYIVTPHLVKELTDTSGKVVKSFDYGYQRQVISQRTGDKIVEILKDGTFTGSTKNVYVEGYNIAAKTGTSQKKDSKEEANYVPYISSTIAYAPAEDPQVVILIAIDEATGSGKDIFDGMSNVPFGGIIAAPVISKVMSEVLPYMKVPKSSTGDDKYNITVPTVTNMVVDEAKTLLNTQKLKPKVIGDGSTVVSQYPAAGSKVAENGRVVLITDNSVLEQSVTVPSLRGYSLSQAADRLRSVGLNLNVTGAYKAGGGSKAVRQSIEAGLRVEEGTIIEVEFIYYDGID